ncbi:hypothetical protein ACQ4M3_07780 [Leptolyngbya sp. AN03gr2]|uniref:hypothetical protein n=1 Tax=unclassified Leptolyngbya TaxID=2650499 RepID=UPI003D31A6A0
MKPSDFNRPTSHPWGMLTTLNLNNVSETEAFLAGLLIKCIEAGDWIALETQTNEDHLCTAGLLTKVEGKEKTYFLTRKAKGLLYVHYGKEE